MSILKYLFGIMYYRVHIFGSKLHIFSHRKIIMKYFKQLKYKYDKTFVSLGGNQSKNNSLFTGVVVVVVVVLVVVDFVVVEVEVEELVSVDSILVDAEVGAVAPSLFDEFPVSVVGSRFEESGVVPPASSSVDVWSEEASAFPLLSVVGWAKDKPEYKNYGSFGDL